MCGNIIKYRLHTLLSDECKCKLSLDTAAEEPYHILTWSLGLIPGSQLQHSILISHTALHQSRGRVCHERDEGIR